MKRLLRLYYRWKNDNFYDRLYDAYLLNNYIAEQNPGNGPRRNYNIDGEKIRGWHKKPYQFSNTHPLIKKYQ